MKHSSKNQQLQYLFRNIGFRNAKFSGIRPVNTNPNKPIQSIGIVLDDMFLWSLSNWEGTSFSGPTVFIYPNKQVFYGNFKEGVKPVQSLDTMSIQQSSIKLEGVWSFMINSNNEDTIQIFGEGPLIDVSRKKQKYLAICSKDLVTRVKIRKNQKGQVDFSIIDQKDVQNQAQKWKVIEDVLSYRLGVEDKSLQSFISHNFIHEKSPLQKIPLSYYSPNTFLYFFTNNQQQSLGAIVQYQHHNQLSTCTRILQIGNFKQSSSGSYKLDYGRKYRFSSDRALLYKNSLQQALVTISQGVFSKNEVYQYENQNLHRPLECKKLAKKYFRQSSDFENKYIYLADADSLYKCFSYITTTYVQECNQRNGQITLQRGFVQNQQNKQAQQVKFSKDRQKEEKAFIQNFNSRKSKYGKYQYELEEAKQIIMKTIANKNKSYNKNYEVIRDRSRSRSRSREHYDHEQFKNSSNVSPYRNYANYSPKKKYIYNQDQNIRSSPYKNEYKNEYIIESSPKSELQRYKKAYQNSRKQNYVDTEKSSKHLQNPYLQKNYLKPFESYQSYNNCDRLYKRGHYNYTHQINNPPTITRPNNSSKSNYKKKTKRNYTYAD